MLYTESEQSKMDLLKALIENKSSETKQEYKSTRRETGYEKWKKSKKAKSEWTIWCCCSKKPHKEPNKKPLLSQII